MVWNLDANRKCYVPGSANLVFLAAKIEQADLPIPKVDTIVSEPIGVLLFHERMVSYAFT